MNTVKHSGVLIDFDRRLICGINLQRWAEDMRRCIMERAPLPRVVVVGACISPKRADELATNMAKWPPLRSFWLVENSAQIEEAQKQP